jgi:MYXO-CTERM domain-containing protein
MTRTMAPALALALALAPATAGAHAIDHLQDLSDVGRNKVPHAGVSHVLVIPSKVGGVISNARLQELRSYFAEEGGPGTFRDYWKNMSRGAYDPIPHLAEPVYYTDCPLPNKTAATCFIELDDYLLLTTGDVSAAIQDLVRRVRDEQGVDLTKFDVNGGTEGQPDGWFDGLILSTDLFDGLGLPLSAFDKEVCVYSAPQELPPADAGYDAGPADGGTTDAGDGGALDAGLDGGALDAGIDGGYDAGPFDAGYDGGYDGGPAFTPCESVGTDGGVLGTQLGIGVVAFIPPDGHEFGHNLGFMDLYNDPENVALTTGLMGHPKSGLSAHSRLQIGWGEVEQVDGEVDELVIDPVLEGGKILRFGEPPRYMLLENRGGFMHNATETDPPGLYMYSIDENELPEGRLGFLELQNGDLFLPNRPEPKLGNVDCVQECYLNVNVPVGCRDVPPEEGNACVLGPGASRNLTHADPDVGHLGYYVEQLDRDFDGSITIAVRAGEIVDAPTDAGATGDDAGAPPADAGDEPPDPGCGCRATAVDGTPALVAFALLGLLALRRRRRS